MLNVLMIDDEEIALDVLEILLLEIGGVSVIGKYQLVSEAMSNADRLQPDIIFLDIEMPGMNGMEAIGLLAERFPHAEIIFVTAYQEYALDAFGTDAIDYLLKPVSKERLAKTLTRYDRLRTKYASSLVEAPDDGSEAVDNPPSKSLYLKTFGSLELYGANGELVTWRTKKTKELFAYLWSYAGQPVYRYHLLDNLWPDTDPERVQKLFHTTLYNLRSLLRAEGFPDTVAFGDERYWIQKGAIQSDSNRLNDLLQSSENGRVTELLSIYRGDYLEMEHYFWAEGMRKELRTSYLTRLEQLSTTLVDAEKELVLRKLLELDPYRRPAFEVLIDQLTKSGQVHAVQQLQEQWVELEKEFG